MSEFPRMLGTWAGKAVITDKTGMPPGPVTIVKMGAFVAAFVPAGRKSVAEVAANGGEMMTCPWDVTEPYSFRLGALVERATPEAGREGANPETGACACGVTTIVSTMGVGVPLGPSTVTVTAVVIGLGPETEGVIPWGKSDTAWGTKEGGPMVVEGAVALC